MSSSSEYPVRLLSFLSVEKFCKRSLFSYINYCWVCGFSPLGIPVFHIRRLAMVNVRGSIDFYVSKYCYIDVGNQRWDLQVQNNCVNKVDNFKSSYRLLEFSCEYMET
jgi:hypothetical protein